jgi:hypothetical protein
MKEWEAVVEVNGVRFFQPVEELEVTKRKMKKSYDKFNERFKNRPELFVDEKTLKKNTKNVFI